MNILDPIPYKPNLEALVTRLHLKNDSMRAELDGLLAEAVPLARPRAAYREVPVDGRGSDFVVAGGLRFTSRVLSVTSAAAQSLFAYIVTCGCEMAQWAEKFSDPFERFLAAAIQEDALGQASQAVVDHLDAQYALKMAASMNPGSLDDFPLEQQRPLFELLAQESAAIGVSLNESLLMQPIKSVSGLHYAVDEPFESCRLCQRPKCPGRRAAYDPTLYQRRFSTDEHSL